MGESWRCQLFFTVLLMLASTAPCYAQQHNDTALAPSALVTHLIAKTTNGTASVSEGMVNSTQVENAPALPAITNATLEHGLVKTHGNDSSALNEFANAVARSSDGLMDVPPITAELSEGKGKGESELSEDTHLTEPTPSDSDPVKDLSDKMDEDEKDEKGEEKKDSGAEGENKKAAGSGKSPGPKEDEKKKENEEEKEENSKVDEEGKEEAEKKGEEKEEKKGEEKEEKEGKEKKEGKEEKKDDDLDDLDIDDDDDDDKKPEEKKGDAPPENGPSGNSTQVPIIVEHVNEPKSTGGMKPVSSTDSGKTMKKAVVMDNVGDGKPLRSGEFEKIESQEGKRNMRIVSSNKEEGVPEYTTVSSSSSSHAGTLRTSRSTGKSTEWSEKYHVRPDDDSDAQASPNGDMTKGEKREPTNPDVTMSSPDGGEANDSEVNKGKEEGESQREVGEKEEHHNEDSDSESHEEVDPYGDDKTGLVLRPRKTSTVSIKLEVRRVKKHKKAEKDASSEESNENTKGSNAEDSQPADDESDEPEKDEGDSEAEKEEEDANKLKETKKAKQNAEKDVVYDYKAPPPNGSPPATPRDAHAAYLRLMNAENKGKVHAAVVRSTGFTLHEPIPPPEAVFKDRTVAAYTNGESVKTLKNGKKVVYRSTPPIKPMVANLKAKKTPNYAILPPGGIPTVPPISKTFPDFKHEPAALANAEAAAIAKVDKLAKSSLKKALKKEITKETTQAPQEKKPLTVESLLKDVQQAPTVTNKYASDIAEMGEPPATLPPLGLPTATLGVAVDPASQLGEEGQQSQDLQGQLGEDNQRAQAAMTESQPNQLDCGVDTCE